MTSKKPTKKAPAKAGADSETAIHLQAFTSESQQFYRKAIEDSRFKRYVRKIGSETWREILHSYERATQRSRWDTMTERERTEWKVSFDKAIDRLVNICADAPTTPEQWGFPARDNVLMNVLHRNGVQLPDPTDTTNFFQKMLDAEKAADEEKWSLVDSLKHYQAQVKADADGERQHVKKPRDAKSERADFIVRLRRYTPLTVEAIVALAQVAFDDGSIDDRLVRRLTARPR